MWFHKVAPTSLDNSKRACPSVGLDDGLSMRAKRRVVKMQVGRLSANQVSSLAAAFPAALIADKEKAGIDALIIFDVR